MAAAKPSVTRADPDILCEVPSAAGGLGRLSAEAAQMPTAAGQAASGDAGSDQV